VDLWEYEKELYKEGIEYIGGVDEVGRGPLVGNVVTACCVLPKDFKLDGLTDSKKLSEKKREEYYKYIIDNCIAYGIGKCSPEEIDKYNILEATKIAMKRAIDEVKKQINLEYVLIDGNMKFDLDIPYKSIVKGDSKSISIAAASVIAKVTRDHEMYELDAKYPMYGFKNHKGYPTKKHIDAIKEYGIIDGYRKTYGPVLEILNENR
jgi:ribonuclease HII